jgi:hypothetical protein
MRKILLTLFALGAASICSAPLATQPTRVYAYANPSPKEKVSLLVPTTVSGEPGDFIRITATTNGKVVKWYVVDKGLKIFPAELLIDTKTAVVSSNKPGKYRVLAYTALADDASDPAVCTVEVVGPVPPPVPPGPTPGPVPDPTPPKVDKLFVICVVPDDESPAVAKVVGDASMWVRLEKAGHRYRVWPKSSPSVAEKKLSKYVDKAGVPAVVLMSAEGKVLTASALPKTAADLEAMVKEYVK